MMNYKFGDENDPTFGGSETPYDQIPQYAAPPSTPSNGAVASGGTMYPRSSHYGARRSLGILDSNTSQSLRRQPSLTGEDFFELEDRLQRGEVGLDLGGSNGRTTVPWRAPSAQAPAAAQDRPSVQPAADARLPAPRAAQAVQGTPTPTDSNYNQLDKTLVRDLGHHGRVAVRKYGGFDSPMLIFDTAAEKTRLGNERALRVDPERNRELNIYEDVIGFESDLHKRIFSICDNGKTMEVAAAFRVGYLSARSNDTNRIRGLMYSTWINFPAGGLLRCPHSGSERGFNHAILADYLAPVLLDGDIEENIEDLRDGLAKITGYNRLERFVAASDWRKFMYKKEVFNPEDPLAGFLKGDLLKFAYLAIYVSPKASTAAAQNVKNFRAKKNSTKASSGVLAGMTAVTPCSLAYIASQVFYSLSSFDNWDESKDMEILYWAIVQWFETEGNPEEEEYKVDLLNWWSSLIFPEGVAGLKVRDTKSTRRAPAQRADNHTGMHSSALDIHHRLEARRLQGRGGCASGSGTRHAA